jgi:hypothetical protein
MSPDRELAVEKARGLLALHEAVHVTRVPTSLGELIEYAVMPRTRGVSRLAEIVLTLVALPLLLLALIAAKRWSRRFTVELSLGNMMLAAPLAGISLYCFARGAGLNNTLAVALAGGMSLAWLLREALRWRTRPG